MLRKLKRKFIVINMALVGVVLLTGCVVLTIYSYNSVKAEVIKAMEASLAISGISGPRPDDGRTQIGAGDKANHMQIPVHSVKYRRSTGEIEPLSENTYIEEETLKVAVEYAATSPNKTDNVPDCGLIYFKIAVGDDLDIAFADAAIITDSMTRTIFIEAVAVAAFMALMYLISLFLAKTAIKPIDENWQRQKRFIVDASHELKTPLTVILANNRILRSHEEDAIKNQLQWIDSTEEEARHMKQLLDDMLVLAKNESADTKLITGDVNVSKLVNRAFLQFEAVAFDKDISLCGDVEDNLHTRGDEAELKQMVMILMDNALKYEPKKGSVSLALRKRGDSLILSVRNANSYIPTGDISHIFDRFYRSDASRSSEGFGLGLAIAKSIAELHGGQIAVESKNPGGTVFCVSLPRA